MRILIFALVFTNYSCSENNCSTLIISSEMESLTHTFNSKVTDPFKMDCFIKWKFNDTIIINGEYIGPKDSIITCTPTDFYGFPLPSINYKRYKATKVEIEYKYCFY